MSVVFKKAFSTTLRGSHIYKKSLTNNGTIDELIFFGVNSINRLSFLRSDGDFISKVTQFPKTTLIFFNKSHPLCRFQNHGLAVKLLRVQVHQISDTFQKFLTNWSEANAGKSNQLLEYPTITFLGMDRQIGGVELNSGVATIEKPVVENIDTTVPAKELPPTRESHDDALFHYKDEYKGIPYFAIDITHSEFLQKELPLLLLSLNIPESEVLNLHEPSPMLSNFMNHLNWFDKREASIFSQGKMFLEWINKNQFCSACGSKNLVINAGSQLECTETSGRYCVVANTPSSNVSHPRTDLAVISSVANDNNDKLLLVNNKRMPVKNLYTCVAGFMDPGETIETCVTREIWEETNVITQQVQMVLSQPWPYPGTLMVGCCGITEFNNKNEIIHLGHDKELRDARWFDFDHVRELILASEALDTRMEDAVRNNSQKEAQRLREEAQRNMDIMLPVKNTVALELIKQIVF